MPVSSPRRARSSLRHAWPGEALNVFGPEVVQFEEIADKSSRAVANDDNIRLSDPLQSRREIWRLANDATLLRLPRSSTSHGADCVAEVVGLELRNVVANYHFERSHRFARIQRNPDLIDHSRLSCGEDERLASPRSCWI